jgi:hypothetical protein
MGTWGTGLFDDDTALDMQGDYLEMLDQGIDPAEATRQILVAYAYDVGEEDLAPVIWFALAATQLELGHLQPEVRRQAVEALASGTDLQRWIDEATPEDAAERRTVLEAFKLQLDAA